MTGDALQWARPWALLLLLALPLVALALRLDRRRAPRLLHPRAGTIAAGPRGWVARLWWLPQALLLAGLALTAVGLARPQADRRTPERRSVEGIDIVIALDLSSSMDAADFRPQNRINVAKEVLTDFIAGRTNDRLGLVVFSGQAYTQSPLTLDYGVLKEVVRQLRTHVLEDGTAIGDALSTALNRLRDSDAKSRVVVIITDGDNNAGKISPLDAAAMAKALHIPVFTILVGKGGKVPFPAGTDVFGRPAYVETEIPTNPELLQQISTTTGGEYYRATDRTSLERGLQKVLDAMERSKLMEGGATANYREDYHGWLIWAFVAAALEALLAAFFLRVFP